MNAVDLGIPQNLLEWDMNRFYRVGQSFRGNWAYVKAGNASRRASLCLNAQFTIGPPATLSAGGEHDEKPPLS